MEGWNKVWKVPSNPNHSVVLQALSPCYWGAGSAPPQDHTYFTVWKSNSVLRYQTQPPHSFKHLYPTPGWNSEAIKPWENKMQEEQPVPGIKSSFSSPTLCFSYLSGSSGEQESRWIPLCFYSRRWRYL